ncbi:VOC family protein [Sphingobium phenoxybenzoativorans]|uniref:VOC family protein n=1 Tax=Sphingobium phenoxybenzoativorans TaxID=1592790 RepID=UPI0009F5DC63|nr:VOC family protein [Sphingobium phenoxybenzoativorans]
MTIGSTAQSIAFVNVTDRSRGVAFYRDVIGLDLLSSDGFGDVFAIGGAKLRLTAMPDYKPSGHPALGWEVADLTAAMAALTGRGIEFIIYPGFGQDSQGIWTSPDNSVKLAWFADPDGNVLMLSST